MLWPGGRAPRKSESLCRSPKLSSLPKAPRENAPTYAQNPGSSTLGMFSASRLHGRLDVMAGTAAGNRYIMRNPPEGKKVPKQLSQESLKSLTA